MPDPTDRRASDRDPLLAPVVLAEKLDATIAALHSHIDDCVETRKATAAWQAAQVRREADLHAALVDKMNGIKTTTLAQLITILLALLGATTTKALGWW